MNIIISTDSSILYGRLKEILSELPDIKITGVTRDLDEAASIIKSSDIHVIMTAFHNIQKNVFRKLKEIKKSKANMIVIVLNNNPAEQYLTQWEKAGADYVFDVAIHFNKVIEVLSGIIYKNVLKTLKSEKSKKRKYGLNG